MQYRHGDHNAIMQLRAWRSQVEVFLPWKMRQCIARDVAREFQLDNL
ncbi:MAG TPA: hypothetical protein IGS40_25660 [Trichormus sp. M33_DOE_039]|nr:hypothetical protein [Trichormus sp. M33_DOE_039]